MDAPVTPGHVQEARGSNQNEPEQEINPTDPSPAPSAPSVSHGAESGGTTLSTLSRPLPVTVSSHNPDDPPALERVREPAESLTHALDPGVASEDTPNRRRTTSATVDVILRGVEESSNAYPPLKSVAKCLFVILNNCEVRSPSPTLNPSCSQL